MKFNTHSSSHQGKKKEKLIYEVNDANYPWKPSASNQVGGSSYKVAYSLPTHSCVYVCVCFS